ncbi:MAG: UDP-N-acetylmuramate dehydrogenase [Sulfurimicrobium sp.]|jgi:UDP-N-acetylmuramate dehydrogenase|nr:UDP-N-acetylmuramate dehydrogenase [Sulfurimicrobium sp.]
MNMTEPTHFAPAGLRGKLQLDEPMAAHVSWRAGGRAERCYTPADLRDLAAFLATCAGPVHFVGLGSNLLVRDGGLKGTVILLHGALNHISVTDEGLVYAEAGVSSPKVASFAAQNNLEGAEFLSGIPGTVGGALAMNAGCYGKETWECVERVLTIDAQGTLRERLPQDYEIGYRHVAQAVSGEQLAVNSKPTHRSPLTAHPEEWYVAAWFRFTPGDGKAAKQKAKEWLAKRMATQPLALPNAGSVFRNPPGDYAARLIEASGLKGFTIGGAQVSEKHANFIVNLGGATAADIESLIAEVKAKVKEMHGVELVREVKIIGDKA